MKRISVSLLKILFKLKQELLQKSLTDYIHAVKAKISILANMPKINHV